MIYLPRVRTREQILDMPGGTSEIIDSLTTVELNQFMRDCRCERCEQEFVAFNEGRYCSPDCMRESLGEIDQIACISVVEGLGWSIGAVEHATKIKPCKSHTVVRWDDIVKFHWTDGHLHQMRIALKLRVRSYRRHYKIEKFKAEWGLND